MRNEHDNQWETLLSHWHVVGVKLRCLIRRSRIFVGTRTHTPIGECCDSVRSYEPLSWRKHTPSYSWDSQRENDVSFPTAPNVN